MQQQIDKLSNDKSAIDATIESNFDQISKFKEHIIDTQKELEQFTAEKNGQKRQCELQLQELQKELKKLKEANNPVPNQIQDLEAQILGEQNHIAGLEAELTAYRAEANASVKKDQLRIDEIERNQANLNKEKDKLTGKIGSLESENAAEVKKAQKMQKWQTNVNKHADKLDGRAEAAHDKATGYGAAVIGCILLTVLTGGALGPVLIPAAIGLAGAACLEKKKEHDVNKEISKHNERVDNYLLAPPV